MQTVLYVLGPFVLYVALAYGVVAAAVALVRLLYTKRCVRQAQLIEVHKLNAYAKASAGIFDDLILQLDANKLLLTYFPTELEERIYRLRATATHTRAGSLVLPIVQGDAS